MTVYLKNAPQEGQLSLLELRPRRELDTALERARNLKTYVMLITDGYVDVPTTGTIIALDERHVTLAINSTYTVKVPRRNVTGLTPMEHWCEYLTPGCGCRHCTTEYGTPDRPIFCKQVWEAMPRERRVEIAESLAD